MPYTTASSPGSLSPSNRTTSLISKSGALNFFVLQMMQLSWRLKSSVYPFFLNSSMAWAMESYWYMVMCCGDKGKRYEVADILRQQLVVFVFYECAFTLRVLFVTFFCLLKRK